ncbi:MAG TPA: amidohydrolase family protein, partial [Myxococcaceae bacterium]|nr:amidohydrolase family protein [Myxococcaceae bacterium]
MPVRVYVMLDGQAPLPELVSMMELWKKTPELGRLTVRSVKMYSDGALGSRGAALFEPYSDDPGNLGLRVTEQEELTRRVREVVARGYQPNVHAIGDRASAGVLEAFVAAGEAAKALRPRVEHLQILQPKDVPLLKQSGAIASMQPTHCTSDAPWAEARLGHGTARQKGAYAWRQALEAGAVLALGSDFPIEDPDPRGGLFSAETRRPAGGPFGPEGWMPEQRLTRQEALEGFTKGAAYAAFAEGRRGMIRVGMDADLTAFGGDVMAVPVDALPKLPIRLTVVGGRVEHEKP